MALVSSSRNLGRYNDWSEVDFAVGGGPTLLSILASATIDRALEQEKKTGVDLDRDGDVGVVGEESAAIALPNSAASSA